MNENSNKADKVLYLITDLKYGGAQTVLYSLVSNINQERYKPSVACLFGGDFPVGDELRKTGIEVIDLRMTNFWRIDALWRLYQLLHREKYSILHTSLFHASLVGRIVGWAAKVPVIITWRQNISLGGRWRDFIYKMTSRIDDKVIVVSNSTLESEIRTTGLAVEKVEVIYNSIDIDRYSRKKPANRNKVKMDFGLGGEEIIVGFIGRFHAQKGIDVLLKAFEKIEKSKMNVRLMLVGDGTLRKKIWKQSQTLGNDNRVLFTGIRKDIPLILSSLDIFVLPSRWEGLPLVLLEAMAAGLPIVATAVGGIPEVVVDGETGFLVPPEDPEALASAITRLIEDSVLRKKFGKAGYKRVKQHFNIQEASRRTEELYFSLLKEKGFMV